MIYCLILICIKELRMPLIKQENNAGYAWAIWKVTESEEELLSLVELSRDEDAEFFAIKHPHKRLEYLAGKIVVREVIRIRKQVFQGMFKDDCGKPHLFNSSDSISLSHSFPLAGAIYHLGKYAGIDIEKPKSKLYKVAQRFLSEEEKLASGMGEKQLCIYWCAKETLYKIYGRKQVVFSKDLFVDPFLLQDEGFIKGSIRLPQLHKSFFLRYLQIDDHIICFNI